MEKYITMLGNYKSVLVKHHTEMIENIKIITGAVNVSEDDEMREIVGDMMQHASDLSTLISIVEFKIKNLKRKQEKEKKEEA